VVSAADAMLFILFNCLNEEGVDGILFLSAVTVVGVGRVELVFPLWYLQSRGVVVNWLV
jgi:hypothetical protein